MTRNSRCIIAKNIKLDKEHTNVLDYTESEMVALVTANKVVEAGTFSFIKVGENVIDTSFSYSDGLKANYIAFQNPYYDNKWFFAFIDEVEYISNGNSRIHFTIDNFATWFDYWHPKTCFVIREHVTNDAVGLHTVPEGLETGEYIYVKNGSQSIGFGDSCYCVATTQKLFNDYSATDAGIPIGLYYTGLTTIKGVYELIALKIQNDEIINSVFVCPKRFFTNWRAGSTGSPAIDGQISYNLDLKSATFTEEIARKMYLADEYYPKNKKLLSYPYSYLQVSNHNGTIVNYNWEDFNLNTVASNYYFTIGGVLSPGCSIFAFPNNYKNITNNVDEGLPLGKYPIGSFNSDTYTNWLTQNGLNTGIGIAGGAIMAGLGIAGAIATGGTSLAITGAVVGGAISVGTSVANVYQHSLAPDQVRGNTNVGDYMYSFGHLNYTFKQMSIKREYAVILDDYFSRMGYKVNALKVPNQTGRTYYNYVQIGSEECIGYSTNQTMSVPASAMTEINNIYRKGVTIWHDHTHVGNYALDNSLH